MRVSQAKAAENRDRIVDAAARLFRARGIDGVGIDAIMEAAGLTHGGFYRHFPSKEGLVAEAVARGLDGAPPDDGMSPDAYLARYLSPRHRDDPGGGCILAALGADVARGGPEARRPLTRAVADRIARLARWFARHDEAAARERAIAALAGMVGALVLARAVDDPALSDEILAAARARLGDA